MKIRHPHRPLRSFTWSAEKRYWVDVRNYVPVIQAALRHAKPTTTAKYTHRNNAVQIRAQSKFLEAIKVAKPAAAL